MFSFPETPCWLRLPRACSFCCGAAGRSFPSWAWPTLPLRLLLIRFAIALSALVLLIPLLKFKRPKTGKPMLYAATTGLVLLGAYQIFICWRCK